MRNVLSRRGGLALATAALILAATLLALPGTASANRGRGHAWGRHRVASYGYAYRPYYVSYYRPRYREVIVGDPYCYDDDIAYVRPVYRTYHHYRHRPRVAVSLSFGSPGFYYGGYGDPYCGW
jgi:hypothetical protein